MSKTEHPTIELCDCDSQQIAQHGYDAPSQTLAVKFHNGGLYHYHGVSQEAADAFKAAKSKGKYLAAHIRNAHKFTKI